MIETTASLWPKDWFDPSKIRQAKPRSTGITMVIDKGLGFHSFCDLMEVGAPYMDICKLGFGTSALYSEQSLKRKMRIAAECNQYLMPGGTFFEIALQHDSANSYISHIRGLGFTAVEISDGTFELPFKKREEAIRYGVQAGLLVCTEYGKKASNFVAELEELVETVSQDLEAGASFIIIEARESGNVGVFNKQGELDVQFIQEVIKGVGNKAHRLIWEAPRKEQQVALLQTLGLDVNLGNIAPSDVLSVEALRRGLRADTSAFVFEGSL
ncbi:phosphosulfolactate synthase [Brevibacillus ginsengisoli]|uniref:phosphosulfolactate synthase n=1 Tax=Brevibacillus ginsengisoli TaxID=363854 RepID=UPI003CF69F83